MVKSLDRQVLHHGNIAVSRDCVFSRREDFEFGPLVPDAVCGKVLPLAAIEIGPDSKEHRAQALISRFDKAMAQSIMR